MVAERVAVVETRSADILLEIAERFEPRVAVEAYRFYAEKYRRVREAVGILFSVIAITSIPTTCLLLVPDPSIAVMATLLSLVIATLALRLALDEIALRFAPREIRECVKLWRRFFAELNREISEACGSPQPRTSPAIREACIHLHTWTALTKATLRNPSKVCRILLDAKIVDRCPP